MIKCKELKPFEKIWTPILEEKLEYEEIENSDSKNSDSTNDIDETILFGWMDAIRWAKELIEEYEKVHEEL